MMRTNTCGELTGKEVDKEVTLCGWVQSRRDHGGIIFIDLRDRYGLTQIVFDPKLGKEAHEAAQSLRREDVLRATGTVKARASDLVNKKIKTGEIEVFIGKLNVLNKSAVPPVEIEDRVEANDDIRLKYRYLDLRRPVMNKRLVFRSKVALETRKFLAKEGFVEIETPLLIRSTPEGARDYIVPSRVNPGKGFSLPQSPQLYKQILMVSGFDRYYQIARCLRDEDLRADRQPEFTQIDIEMSFVDQDDVIDINERLLKHLFKECLGKDIKIPFQRFSYEEAMNKYGSEKPDLRFGLELIDVTKVVKKSDFGVFKNAEAVKCLVVEKEMARKEVDRLIDWATKEAGAKGLAYIKVTDKGLESSIVKFFSEEVQKELISAIGAKKGSTILFVADKLKKTNEILGELRLHLGKTLGLIKPGEFKFCWTVDFPLFEYDEEAERWSPMHHIFSMPQEHCMKYLDEDPGKVLGYLYDIVLNGTEAGGGSIRIHSKEIQESVLNVIGMNYEQAKQRFGFLLEAFQYGAPPHGGLAFGFDRLVALMQGINDIREIMAFPKNKAAQCPMDGCPSEVDATTLKENHIKFDVVKKK